MQESNQAFYTHQVYILHQNGLRRTITHYRDSQLARQANHLAGHWATGRVQQPRSQGEKWPRSCAIFLSTRKSV
ncbi:hypothetical protein LX32DRAFT_84538 [Colletotrichum zoysiae]|uniref:Uncharacterized protein n=1 Tax=Colletotrichum zoysiae TaxID=1216348 RepID=A0AAD9H9J4_9PEZI|nr:hypothetical protein LX32DRAFT_84538 [Colletotrichum zoysiae]